LLNLENREIIDKEKYINFLFIFIIILKINCHLSNYNYYDFLDIYINIFVCLLIITIQLYLLSFDLLHNDKVKKIK
jgi:hypothetical protein